MIAAGEAHVWIVDAESVEASPGLLSRDEQERAARFRFEHDRRRWIAAHVALREILSRYTSEVRILSGKHGKPFLANGAVQFSLSHSGTLAVAAVSAADVGVDVEEIREGIDIEEIAVTAFSGRERARLGEAPPADRRQTFFRIWARKEALLKSRGLGLGSELVETLNTWVYDLPVGPGYAGAMAGTGATPRIVMRRYARSAGLRPAPQGSPEGLFHTSS